MCAPAALRGGKLLTKKPWGLTMAAGGMMMGVLSEVRGCGCALRAPARGRGLLRGNVPGVTRGRPEGW